MRKAKFVRVGFSLGLATLTAISNPLLRLSLIGIGAIAPFSAIAPAEAATLTNWQFDPNTRELRVTVPEGTTPRYFLLAEPPRIVLDLPNTQIGAVPEQQVFNGAVRQIRVGQFQPGLTRIVIELVADVEFAPGQVELRQEGDRWILRPLLTDGSAAPDVATAPVQPAPVQPPHPEVQASDAGTTEVIPETPAPETTAIAPSPAPQPETTAAELGNDLPQLNPAPVVPDTSPNIFDANSDVPEVIPETDSAVTPESETTADVVPELPSAELPSAELPPLEPGALEIPVEPASEVPENLELVPPTSETEPDGESVAERVEPEESEQDLPAELPENLANSDDVATEPTSQDAQEGEVSSEEDEAIALEAEEPINEAVSPTPELPSAASSPQIEIDQPEAQPSPAQSAEAEQNFAVPVQEEPEAREEIMTLEPGAQTEPEAIAPEPEMQEESEPIALESDGQAPEAIAPAPQIPRALPPATFSTSPSVTVAVPPLSQAPSNPTVVEPPGNTPVAPSQSPPPAALPPATFSPNPTSQVSVPPVSTIPSPTAAASASPAPSEDEIEFGRPISRQPDSPPPSSASTATAPQDDLSENELPENDLPDQNVFSDQNVAVAPTSPNILLPSGTTLSLRYPGETSLPLESGVPRQEVLLLDQPVLDRNGNLIAEAGTQVIGRFETGSQGSQFIAQAIALQGQNVLLEAESATLAGDREVSEDILLQNSALGALALTVLGGFTGIGLLGGLAAGATATYLTAPQPAIIQPNQIVEVRLTEDLPRP
ncbi:AMIN domain-containing protein [Cyanobacteria bacterium FACHB-471]|nr:AMIN domain-containing protein [Cyanobacteria bacterium FACHB-471]